MLGNSENEAIELLKDLKEDMKQVKHRLSIMESQLTSHDGSVSAKLNMITRATDRIIDRMTPLGDTPAD